jgi:hypothetical protein
MDMLFLLDAGLLWGIMVLLVLGFKRLEEPAKGKS